MKINGRDLNIFYLDEIIGQVSEVLSSHFPDYVALLTADMPRDVSKVLVHIFIVVVDMLYLLCLDLPDCISTSDRLGLHGTKSI